MAGMRQPAILSSEVSSTAQIINIAPVVTSRDLCWPGVLIERYQIPEQGSSVQEICYAHHTVIIQAAGNALVSSTNLARNQIVSPDEIIIFPRGLPFSARADGANDFITIHLDSALLARAGWESINPDRVDLIPQLKIHDSNISQLGRMLLNEAEANAAASALCAESLATVLSVHLLRNYSRVKVGERRGGLPPYRRKRVIEYLHAHLDTDITLTELAAVADISPYHFARAFKQSTGYTPFQYLTKIRIERAQSLLIETELPIVEIAHLTGFASQSHLNKVFAKLTHTTPGQYRNRRK